jgi:hypothetical protein
MEFLFRLLAAMSRSSLFVGCTLVIAAGCASVPERHPLPESLSDVAAISGIPGARQWADEAPQGIEDWFDLSKDELKRLYPATFGQPHNYLAISGGGANGAFGAGLLCGWTETGTRPEFTAVTGVSTGALIAPFVFLGPEYDPIIKEFYTSYSTKDLVETRGLLKVLTGDAATDSTPMRNKLIEYIDEDIMVAIAREFRRGRSLYVVTTNLDAARPVVWNIGRIADSGSPDALQLIRDVILASASIPGAFPPVIFDVEADGGYYDELHVDGGATSIVYLYPIGLDWARLTDKLEVPGQPKVYILRNGRWKKAWTTVKPSTIQIAIRTMDSLMGSVVLGDAYRIYLSTQRDGVDFNLAYIPDDFNEPSTEAFDQAYMIKLFDLGYQMGVEGYQWRKTPPGYDVTSR